MLPAGNRLFGTAPVGPEVWLLAVLFAASMWILEEARKLWLRRTARPDQAVEPAQ